MTNSHTAITRQIEGLKQQTRNGMDYWMGRDLVRILGYRTWERFAQVINRARDACRSTGRDPENHFLDTGKMVEIGSGAMRERGDWFLSRYACYLIAMNGDPRKPEIGAAQTYFAVKTREKELDEDRALDERRVDLRVKSYRGVQEPQQDRTGRRSKKPNATSVS